MSWKLINNLEFIGAFIFLFIIFSLAFFYINKQKNRLLRTTSLIILVFLPMLFFTIHLLRQFLGVSKVIYITEQLSSFKGLSFLCILIIVLILLRKFWFNKLYEIIILLILILLPLSFFTTSFLFFYGFSGHKDKVGFLDNLSNQENTTLENNNLYVFLFDELDYSILYNKDGVISKNYKNLKKFSNKSTNYLNARAPGKATLSSITQLLLGKKIENIQVCGKNLCSGSVSNNNTLLDTSENIFKISQKHGYNTALVGWVHKYCLQYITNLDYCRSYSLYNNSSFYSTFSLLNPIYTNIILLPNHFPFGLLKNPIYTRLHHKNNTNVQDLSLKIIEKDKNNPIFLFAHYSIPHIPYLYKNKIFQPSKNPFKKNIENYKEQLIYVDKLFGELIEKIKEENQLNKSTIVLLSDHGLRNILEEDQLNHVPMIIYKGSNPKYKKISHMVETEKILLSLIKNNF